MDTLPENPFDNVREGISFLRLSGECPEKGILMEIRGFELTTNPRFKDKPEYHWDVVHYTPAPIEKICTESSKGFCTALKNLGIPIDKMKGHVLHVQWVKENIGARDIKHWNIKEVSGDDLQGIF